MDNSLEVFATGRDVLELPAIELDSATFVADQPDLGELEVTEVRWQCMNIGPPIRIILTSFTISDEAGRWTLRLIEDSPGDVRRKLEYHATEKFGTKVRNPAVMHWTQGKDEEGIMISD